jgi:hypothetical protein
MKSITSISVIALCISCLAANAVEAVQGRAYVERQREIYKMAKAIEPDRADVRAFGELLEDLDGCDLSESTRDFWRTARSVKAAMEKELAQINERANKDAAAQRKDQVERAVQKAEMLDSATQSTTEPGAERTPLQERAHQMEMVYREAEGLRNPMGMADLSVVKRYRLLAGKFHQLMKEDVEAMEAEIERLKEENRRSR